MVAWQEVAHQYADVCVVAKGEVIFSLVLFLPYAYCFRIEMLTVIPSSTWRGRCWDFSYEAESVQPMKGVQWSPIPFLIV